MPQKRNPVGSTLARANARLAAAHAGVLLGSLEQEHERAAGAWQAEWEALTGALAHTGGALAALAGALESLEVDAARMRANLELTGGLGAGGTSRVPAAWSDSAERKRRRSCARRPRPRASATRSSPIREPASMPPSSMPPSTRPTYLGSAAQLVDRALAFYESSQRGR